MNFDIDNIPFGKLREIFNTLAGIFGAAPTKVIAFSKSTPVMIRDHMAGLFVGVLAEDIAVGDKGWCLAPGARKIHYWARAAGPEGAAKYGPGAGSRVCVATDRRTGCDLVEMCALSAAELKLITDFPEWKPS